jgi:hypothetical protein
MSSLGTAADESTAPRGVERKSKRGQRSEGIVHRRGMVQGTVHETVKAMELRLRNYQGSAFGTRGRVFCLVGWPTARREAATRPMPWAHPHASLRQSGAEITNCTACAGPRRVVCAVLCCARLIGLLIDRR